MFFRERTPKMLTVAERKAIVTVFKQFQGYDTVPDEMVLHSDNGMFLGTLVHEGVNEYNTKDNRIKIDVKYGDVLVEFREGYLGYTFIYHPRKSD